ncbi:hypothetical protein BDD12DRAFT_897402 [Trichophaea hybrida]|nr:hypothetical protein BDD12DRAFT_897402 [Trichophaea hybrida]
MADTDDIHENSHSYSGGGGGGLVFEFLCRDYRPTLMLRLSSERYDEPMQYNVLFKNGAYRKCQELNEDGMYRSFANMAGSSCGNSSSCRCGSWSVHVTLVDDGPGGSLVAVVTAEGIENERTVGNQDLKPSDGNIPDDGILLPPSPPIVAANRYFMLESENAACGWSGAWAGAGTPASSRSTETTPVNTEEQSYVSEIDSEKERLDLQIKYNRDSILSIPDFDTIAVSSSKKVPAREYQREYDPSLCNHHGFNRPHPRRGSTSEGRPHQPITDWKIPPTSPDDYDPPHFKYLRSVDWSKTAFGPPCAWSPTLRSLALGIMENSTPVALYWGPSYDCMYNNQYRLICHEKDPPLLGQSFEAHWPELWDFFRPLLDASYYESKNIRREAVLLIFHSGDNPESSQERYFDFSLLPIVQDEGIAEGVLEITVEQTINVVTTRRVETLGRLSNSLRGIQDFDGKFWDRVIDAFDDNTLDSPTLILYRTTSSYDDTVQHLQQAIGVSPGGVFAPYLCFLTGIRPDLFHKEMRIAKEQNKVAIKRFSAELRANGELNSRGFDEAPFAAAVIPIQVSAKSTCGFLILGLNSKRPFDSSYKFWLECIRKEVAAAATNVWLHQEELARVLEQERQGAMKQLTIELREQLTKRTEALRHSELLFTKMAEILPVGLTLVDLDGRIFYSNPTVRRMYHVNSDKEMNEKWKSINYHEDRERVAECFDHAVATKSSICMHHRVGNDNPERGWEYWVAASVCVQVDESTGEVQRFMVTLVDITSPKQNEEYQRRLSHHAVERRRQQENFIDIFSHELLNPFSATLQCADSILTSDKLPKYRKETQTILVCVQHQKRIIVDVLTLSKLESLALTVVPVSVTLHESVAQMIKIFQSELLAKRIRTKLIIEDSYKTLQVDWVMADPSRFSQVLVNLLTNEIKFSCPMSTGKREIIVRLAASKERPRVHGNVEYQTFEPPPENKQEGAQCNGADWGTGEPLYIQSTVEDTGIGISKKWQAKLFQRFEQVPKTHVTYSGSGLGLFICRRLCRIQGGEIGFWSEEGKGSQFAFFIKVYRSEHPGTDESAFDLTNLNKFGTDSSTSTPTVVNISAAAKPAPPVEKPKAYRVLIVEDNLINQEVLRRQLKNEGCVTHVANNGQQALDFVRSSSFGSASGKGEHLDIILMDMEMPVMDGCTATRKIRELEKSGVLVKHVPIMGISANARPEQVAMMTEVGMDDAMPKPFRIPMLLDRFRQLMKKLSPSSRKQSSSLEVEGALGKSATILKEEEKENALTPPPPTPGQLHFRLNQLWSGVGVGRTPPAVSRKSSVEISPKTMSPSVERSE